MKLSRDWISDYVDISDLSDEQLGRRFTEIGHAIESVEKHGDDTVFDLEITTNRVDAMSHFGMARELAAALGREVLSEGAGGPAGTAPRSGAEGAGEAAGSPPKSLSIRIEAPEMCSRYSGLVIRGVKVGPSPEKVRRRLEAAGLRPINNIVDVTNYVMLDLGHPLHAFDLDRIAERTIVVRAGRAGETMRSLDGETRAIDPETVVIADAARAVALGGIIGGAESEIGDGTANVLLECAWFNPSVIRRTAKRLGIRTDASYRFERRVDPNGTLGAIERAAAMVVELAGGEREPVVDVVAGQAAPKTLRLRSSKLQEAGGGAVGDGYALALFTRLGFSPSRANDGIDVTVPAFRGDIHEEMDLVEEVLRFFGLDNVPASLPRLTTGDIRVNRIADAEDEARRILAGCGLAESVTYSFIRGDANALFSDEPQLAITNSLSENIAAMRLSLVPGLLETVAFNRSYGNRDGGVFEVGRTYHRAADGVVERRRIGVAMFGTIGTHWGDAKRPADFFDIKGIVAQIGEKFHVDLEFGACDRPWLARGKRAVARHGDRTIAALGFIAHDVLQRFGIKGDVVAAEIDLEALLESTGAWTMAPVARFPGVPMILAMTHGRDLEYRRIVDAIRAVEVPHLHDVGLRDRFIPEGEENVVKTTLGMWYQAFDRSLTQDEVNDAHQRLARQLAERLPVTLL